MQPTQNTQSVFQQIRLLESEGFHSFSTTGRNCLVRSFVNLLFEQISGLSNTEGPELVPLARTLCTCLWQTKPIKTPVPLPHYLKQQTNHRSARS